MSSGHACPEGDPLDVLDITPSDDEVSADELGFYQESCCHHFHSDYDFWRSPSQSVLTEREFNGTFEGKRTLRQFLCLVCGYVCVTLTHARMHESK